MHHELKTDPVEFDEISRGVVSFTIRKDDRGYQRNDHLFLRKTRYSAEEMAAGKPLEYTGNAIEVIVEALIRSPSHGLQEGWVILSIRPWVMSVETIDWKYRFTAINPCSGNMHTEKDAVLFLAKDKAFLEGALPGYIEKCIELGVNPAHLDAIRLLSQRVRTHQALVEQKTPDTDLPCEIRRCVDGEGVYRS